MDNLGDIVEHCSDDGKEEQMTSEEIFKIYERNKAHKLHKELSTPDSYLKKVTKMIPLDDLYEVLDYIYIGTDQEICPVLLEIKDTKLREQENEDAEDDK